jgi:hypothetical protein
LFCSDPYASFVGERQARNNFMRFRLPFLLAGIVLIGALLFWLSRRSQNAPGTGPAPLANANEAAAQPGEPVAAPTEDTGNEAVEINAPILFYGKLEDQGGQPVADAAIDATTTFQSGDTTGTNRWSARSNAQGIFQLAAGEGESLELFARKQGYALASTNTLAFYGGSVPGPKRHHPDPGQPVLIRMWKLQGAEPLATFSGSYNYYPGQTPLCFDFVAQTPVTTNGDIRIKINRPGGVISANEQPEWSIELEGVEGGVQEIDSGTWVTTYWAPVSNYHAKQVLDISTNTPHPWSTDAAAYYFVQSRHGGIYTKLSLKVSLNPDSREPALIELAGVMNTNGSCNWEGDPALLTHN